MTQAYPLQWPVGWIRTPAESRKKSAFATTLKGPDMIRKEMVAEIQRLGGRDLIISSNVPVRADGMPVADQLRRRITDPGVAVYFEMKGRPQSFACDRWETTMENMRAVTLTVEALRGIERWGSSDMMERAFTGFAALPPPVITPLKRDWWVVLDVHPGSDLDVIEAAYKALLRIHHPDLGGSADKTAEINVALTEARKARAV